MYLLDAELELNWTLYAEVAHPTLEDLSVRQHRPDQLTPVSDVIEPGNYIPPTIDTVGCVTYKFIPNEIGLWVVTLYVSDVRVGSHDIFVSVNDSTSENATNI